MYRGRQCAYTLAATPPFFDNSAVNRNGCQPAVSLRTPTTSTKSRPRPFASDVTQQNGAHLCHPHRTNSARFPAPPAVPSAQKEEVMSPSIDFRRQPAIRKAILGNDLRESAARRAKTQPRKPRAPDAIVGNCCCGKGQYRHAQFATAAVPICSRSRAGRFVVIHFAPRSR